MAYAAAEDPARPAIFAGPAAFEALLEPRAPAVPYVVVSRERRFGAAGAIRSHRPGTALLLTDSLSSAILAFLAGAPERVGYGGELRDPFLTKRVPRRAPSRSRPRVEEYAELAHAAGVAVTETRPSLEVRPEERARAGALLSARGHEPGAPYAVIAPGASYGPAKRWDPERFAALARALRERHGARTVLVGGNEDRAVSAAVAAAAGGPALDLTGRTDLPALAGLLAGAVIAVSNDSGVMHLAAALGRPTLAVFGSTSPVWSGAPGVRALYAAYPCSPCFRRACPIGYGCLRAIEAAGAIEAAEELLA